jgi:phosphatidate cytidylyltransferase
MGTILILLTIGALLVDRHWSTFSPFLLALTLSLALVSCGEILRLFGEEVRPPSWLCYLSVALILALNWLPILFPTQEPWRWLLSVFVGTLLATLIFEMARFTEPGNAVVRVALTLFTVSYLAVLPSFLVQLRRPGTPAEPSDANRATVALALAIFVPKCCDIGAYFTGRALGRHKMSPILSPKKTWEGAAGGLAAAALVAVGINSLGPAVHGLGQAAGLGLSLGAAGILGDLAESLIKRDFMRKDASRNVPGFGGVLDVIDSILFAAPVAYWWLEA